MAISGAYTAGLVKGFGTDFAGRIDERTKLQEKYADLMIDSAKAKAPKYAAQTAAYKNTVTQAKQLKDEFGFTDAEIVGIASKYDISKIYTDLFNQKAAAVQAGSVLGFDKGIVLNTLNLPAEASLPEGMSMEDGLRQVILNTQQNLDDSSNPKSEVSRRNAFGKAMANLLSLNPRASAEDQVKGMQIAGFSAEELMAWSPEAGRGDMFPEISAGPLSLPGQDYKATDYESRKNQYYRDFARQFKLLNEDTGEIDATMGDAFKDSGASAVDVARDIDAASLLFAELDKKIAFKGYGAGFGDKSQRSGVLNRLRIKVNTPEELAALVKLESSGKITQMILDTNGTFDDDDLEALLTGEPREDKPSVTSADDKQIVTQTEAAITAAETPAAITKADTAPEINANEQAAIASMPNGNQVARMLAEQEPSTEEPSDIGMDTGEALTADTAFLLPKDADKLTSEFLSGEKTKSFLKKVFPDYPSDAEIVAGAENFNNAAAVAISNAASSTVDWFRGLVGTESGVSISDWLNGEAERIAGKPKVTAKDVEDRQAQAAKVFTDALQDAYNFGADVYEEVVENAKQKIAGSGILTAAEQMEKRIQDNDRQFLADKRNFPQPLSRIVTPAQSEEDKALEASMIAIDEERKRIQDMDRQFLADEKNYPQPLKAMTSIEPLSINTPAELDAAIEERVGEMPPDYKKQVAKTVASINKILKGFESKANLSVDTAIHTVSPGNLAEAISNLTERMFDETLEERIMQNEGQENRAIAFAKLQQQLSELTLFPKRVPVDMNDIDPYPTMDAMASERLHSLQDDINESILSATKKLLSRIGFGNSSTEEVAEVKPEPLMAKPKKAEKPKEMTSSDRARLKRAQKARELGKDTGLLETLVEKYGIALVQKEMGL